ncbi:uncharacterized protein LOC109806335 [Cajanus cajan]|uniref:uncharacterized protein LOC109806335 n=1 Tax=Cajanus cajan TaxID=3821 RepID=UPI00098DBA06|nr:uncharacterized protein LOC109806335 [Cajanus cajan]
MVAKYVDKFDELVYYCSHYHGEGGETVKCVKFVNGLHLEVKVMINYQEIYHYPTLENKCKVYDHDNQAHATHYKSVGPIRGGRFGGSSRSNPYYTPTKFQGNQARGSGSKSFVSFVVSGASSGVSVSTPFSRCKRCGRTRHKHTDCPNKETTCFNCRGRGHIST